MDKRRNQNIDGFVVRRRSPGSGRQASRNIDEKPAVPNQFLRSKRSGDAAEGSRQPINSVKQLPRAVPTSLSTGVSTRDISASLHELDDKKQPRKKRRLRISRRRIAFIVITILLMIGVFFGVKVLIASSQLFSGNIFDLLGRGATLKTDENGRSNILVFGTSEDDPGHKDAGANLTDSIMIVSLNQETKDAVMISVPRDLWVDYGEGCMSGYEGKINVVYECGAGDDNDEPAGAKKLMDIVGDSFGLDIQYYAHVNYTVVRDTVNAVGGVTVEIDSDDPRGILDRNFDWACNYRCHYVKWPNGPAQLNGDQALALARARNAAGGYGLGGGNFDREQYQQKIIVALKDKAASVGTLANPVAVTNILDALGNNVRTNFSAAEVKTLINLASEIPSSSIRRVNLVETGKAVLTTGNVNGQSTVQPRAGTYDFSEVQEFIRKKLTSTASNGESVSVEVLNGSDYMGVAGEKAAELEAAGFSDVTTGDTPSDSSYGSFVWYDLSGGSKTGALTKLESVLGKSPAGKTLPTGVQSSADFVIIVGNGAN
ncbi:LytR family transcriptional regulator [Patescibacteria group bacterium]|nr:MAG: LytR family transcriptional regulator [Patescibacteria group bacterium]